ncbi:MAG TPA: hypothetical protein VIJ50_13160 [Solirubrobacteraceae bacterium]
MPRSFDSFLPSDIRLLLRADAEQRWLHHEVLPVLRHLETPEELQEQEVGAALAYLEAMWGEATARAVQTDAAHSSLSGRPEQDEKLAGPAGRYHAAVTTLRGGVARRIAPFVEPSLEPDMRDAASGDRGLRLEDARPDGCPRAA